MFAGFLPLLLNPQAWVVMGLTALLAFGGGVVKGWNASNADHWRTQATELERASKQKDDIISADAARAATDAEELAKRDAFIESMIHETPASRCTLSGDELGKLRSAASGDNLNSASVSRAPRGRKGRGKP